MPLVRCGSILLLCKVLAMSRFWIVVVLAWAGILHAGERARGADGSVTFDFRQPGVAEKWAGTHDVDLTSSMEGLRVAITGADPYFTGPLFQTPPTGQVIVRIRLQSSTGGGGQLFYYSDGPSEGHSMKFSVPGPVISGIFKPQPAAMTEVFVPLPVMGPKLRFRLDPPGTSGECVIESISVVSGLDTTWPTWERISRPIGEDAAVLSSGILELRFSKAKYGVFEIQVDGRPMGTSGVLPQVAVEQAGQVVWLGLEDDRIELVGEHTVRTSASAQLPGGGELKLQQQFIRAEDGLIEVEAKLSTSVECQLVYAPLLMLFPGDGAFGDQKGQAIFPGVEYLENEPSSSDADVDAARALRRVPAAHKITFPLMAVQAEGRYLGVIWNPETGRTVVPECQGSGEPLYEVAALFDSPDRLFGTKSHVLGLISPNAGDGRREDGQVLPRLATTLRHDHPIMVKAKLIAGLGNTVIPAVQRYVNWQGEPIVPRQRIHGVSWGELGGLAEQPDGFDSKDMAYLLTAGWLDSPIRVENQFRHAVAGTSFPAQPATDAIWMMEQLAAIIDPEGVLTSAEEAIRLRAAAKETLAALPPQLLHHAAVGHIRSPNGTLLFGDPLDGMQQAREVAIGLLAKLGPEGKFEYVRHPDRPDFARTHWSKEANGLAAPIVARALDEAAFSGDRALIDQAIAQLRKLDKYANTVPRGAQTWEIPLHTPDILASAHLVKAYTLGYELTRDPKFLEQAKYWAWTGVPFVYQYLQFPHGYPEVGPYSTIAVLGATHWDSVLWIGLPVQWCGLVYADALQHLYRHDKAGPWRWMADGIVLSGLQQTYPTGPHEGLLPDSFDLLAQSRNPADINPGTLQIPAMRTFEGWESYDVQKIVESGWTVHAPAGIVFYETLPTKAVFVVDAWTPRPYSIVIHGLKSQPHVELRAWDSPGEEESKPLEERFVPATGTLILKLSGRMEVTLDTSHSEKAP